MLLCCSFTLRRVVRGDEMSHLFHSMKWNYVKDHYLTNMIQDI